MPEWVKSVLGIASLVISFGAYFLILRQLKRMSAMTTLELWEIARKQEMFLHSAAAELHKRGEDLTPLVAQAARMAIDGQLMKRQFGSDFLRKYFPDLLRDVEYNPRKVSPEARAYLETLAAERREHRR